MSALDNVNVVALGASKNIGYFAALRLLQNGATVTFFLRKPDLLKEDSVLQKYVAEGKAVFVKGDGLIKEDVKNLFAEATKGGKKVDFVLFTVGFAPSEMGLSNFGLKGLIINPPDLVTRCFYNTLIALPSPDVKFIALSTTGLTKSSHKNLPFLWKPLYGLLLRAAHEDKAGVEAMAARQAGWNWDRAANGPPETILPSDWFNKDDIAPAGSMKNLVIVRPSLLVDGDCKADSPKAGKEPYRVQEDDISSYTITRKDVGHFIAEDVVKNWETRKNKVWAIGY